MNYEKLDNEQKELVKHWVIKFCDWFGIEHSKYTFIEKHLTPEPVITAGKWYKSNDGHLWFIEEVYKDKAHDFKSYGFGSDGVWYDSSDRIFFEKSLHEATHEEVESRLITEAKRRGYKNGNYTCLYMPKATSSKCPDDLFYIEEGFDLWHGDDANFNMVFENGKWAEIIDDKGELKATIAKLRTELSILEAQLCK